MIKKSLPVCSALLIFGASGLTFVQTIHAAGFNPINMMNPSKWLGGGNRDRYDDYDRYGPGYGGYYGPGYGAYGPGYGGYGPGYGGGHYGPGYGGYGPGYGGPGYGYAPAPAYAAPTHNAPASSDRSKDQQIQELQERIQRLERSQHQTPAPTPPLDGGAGSYQGGDYPESKIPSSDYRDSGYPSFTPTYRPLGQ